MMKYSLVVLRLSKMDKMHKQIKVAMKVEILLLSFTLKIFVKCKPEISLPSNPDEKAGFQRLLAFQSVVVFQLP